MAKKRRKGPSKPQEGRGGSDPSLDAPDESEDVEGGKAGEAKGGEKGGVELIPQPHGGALLSGGQPGQTPGPGRPPSRIKAALRKSFDERIDTLEAIADDEDASLPDRMKALDMMAKYSDLDLNVDIDLVEKLGAVVAAEIEDEEAMMRIKEQWLEIVASRIALG